MIPVGNSNCELIEVEVCFKAEAELRHIRLEKDKYQSEYTRKVEHVGGDFDKLTVNQIKENQGKNSDFPF